MSGGGAGAVGSAVAVVAGTPEIEEEPVVTEYSSPASSYRAAPGGGDRTRTPHLPYSYPRRRAAIGGLFFLLTPIFISVTYVFANYPVDRFLLNTTGSVANAWIAAAAVPAFFVFMVVLDGRFLRATTDGIMARATAKQYEFAWSDIARIEHTETGLTISDQQGETHTIELIERGVRARMQRRITPMVQVAADLEQLKAAVRAPKALGSQVRVGRVRPSSLEWVLILVVLLSSVLVAGLRTAGVAPL